MTLYPAFLDLRDRKVLLVGGGTVAASKLEGLLVAGARVTVIAPLISPEIRSRNVHIIERGFEPADLDTAWWVVAAATPAVNREVAAAAEIRRVFVNAVDDKAAATAFLGGVVRRGPVEIAISTGGAAPALAGLLREALDAMLPQDLERWIAVAIATRTEWKAANVPIAERRPLLLRALEELYASKASAAGGDPGHPDVIRITSGCYPDDGSTAPTSLATRNRAAATTTAHATTSSTSTTSPAKAHDSPIAVDPRATANSTAKSAHANALISPSAAGAATTALAAKESS